MVVANYNNQSLVNENENSHRELIALLRYIEHRQQLDNNMKNIFNHVVDITKPYKNAHFYEMHKDTNNNLIFIVVWQILLENNEIGYLIAYISSSLFNLRINYEIPEEDDSWNLTQLNTDVYTLFNISYEHNTNGLEIFIKKIINILSE